MNGAATSERAIEGVTRLRLADGPLLRPVLCRVVSMVLTQADWPLDRLEDALLVCDALSAHEGESSDGERLTFSIDADEHGAELRVRELTPESAERLVAGACVPLVGNVLEQVAERVIVQPEQAVSGTQLAITLSAR
ncbi:MAG TPA: hypothetical protein VHS55_09770 [Solirubrobacteraceae bacterium]|jgi:serine/threonine-protein kinase RsbW|nr:hypothetical protein [Solirubrobacteraceae bacterium]